MTQLAAVLTPTPAPPGAPQTLVETGLHPDTLAQLMLKTLIAGESSGTQLSECMRVAYSVFDALVQHARVEKLVEVRGASGAGNAGYRYALTDLGRDRAMQFLDINRYVGPAPVPLGQYNAYVRACMAARPWVDRATLSTGFDGEVILWDVRRGVRVEEFSFRGGAKYLHHVAFAPPWSSSKNAGSPPRSRTPAA